jgi:cell fate (sporulation/competence/biofilm development) regulator YlbF (YheA/YmcA/DUF963 family)
MDRINACTQDLILAIQESDEYMQFCEIRDQVKEEPELRRQINAFRMHIFQVQNSHEPLDMYDEQQKLCQAYEEFRRNKLVNDYLLAELRVCRMLQKITAELADSIDIDTDEIADKVGEG